MKLIIGNKVNHKTLGEGTITAVDEEFCTVSFASGEAMFRLPDAFDNGFLTSPAWGVPDESEAIPPQEEKPVPEGRKEVPKKKPVYMVIAAFVLPLVMAGPFVYIFIACYLDGHDRFFLYLSIFGIVLYAFLVFLGLKVAGEDPDSIPEPPRSGMDPATKLKLGILGGLLISKEFEKERQKYEKDRYESLFWQESVRNKKHRD